MENGQVGQAVPSKQIKALYYAKLNSFINIFWANCVLALNRGAFSHTSLDPPQTSPWIGYSHPHQSGLHFAFLLLSS